MRLHLRRARYCVWHVSKCPVNADHAGDGVKCSYFILNQPTKCANLEFATSLDQTS